MKKSLLKGTLLLSSMFLLAACQTDEKVKEVESNADTVVESVKEDADAEVEAEKEKLDEVKEEADAEVESEKDKLKEKEDEADAEVESAEEDKDAEVESAKEESKSEEEVEKEAEEESKEADKESKEAEKESEKADEKSEEAEKESEEAETLEEEADEKSEEAETLEDEAEAIVLPAFDPEAELQDGEYTVIGEKDEEGLARQFTIKVQDGEIKEAVYDIIDEEETLLGLDKDFLKAFEEKHSMKFEDLKKEYEAVLRENKDPEAELELGSQEDKDFFKEAAKVLLTLAQEGKEEVVHLENVSFE